MDRMSEVESEKRWADGDVAKGGERGKIFLNKNLCGRIHGRELPVGRRRLLHQPTCHPLMKQLIFTARRACLLPLMGLVGLASHASAAVMVTGTTMFDAGTSRFTYSYSVMNSGTTENIIQVTFPVSATAALMGITAPTGFKLTYDTVGARVNFIEDDSDFTMQTFAADSTVSGFSFTSMVGPGPSEFIASDVNQDFTGFTTAPIPEPSSLMLGLLAVPALWRRRRS